MRIWHVNIGNHAGAVDGVAVAASQLAASQAEAGHEVRLVVAADPVHHEVVRSANGERVELTLGASARTTYRSAQELLRQLATRPDVMHLHSVFRPAHRLLALQAKRRGLPVVLSAHAGLASFALQRDRTRKYLYGAVLERRFYRHADGVHALQAVERDDVARYSGRRGTITVIPNPVDVSFFSAPSWQPRRGPTSGHGAGRRSRIVLLCRFDVYHKGLDRLASIAADLPEVDFEVYGTTDKNQPELAEALIATAPDNLRLLPPVQGDDKVQMLLEADLFLLPSRVEGLSLALAEAMTLGMPCGVSSYVGESLDMARNGTALVLDDEPSIAAAQIGKVLADPDRRAMLGRAGQEHARREFHPAVVRDLHLAHYDSLIGANYDTG